MLSLPPTVRVFVVVEPIDMRGSFDALAGSSEGAHRACVLLGIVATCRAVGVPVQAYLAWAFERLGTHREQFGVALEQFTPAAFKAARG